MKIKYLVVLVLILASMTQPIFAEKKMGTTQVELDVCSHGVYNSEFARLPKQHYIYYIRPGSTIQLEATLRNFGPRSNSLLYLRYLNFEVYKANADGTNGDLVYSQRKIIGYFSKYAKTGRYQLSEGEYNVFAKYNGNIRDHLKPSVAFHKLIIKNPV